MTSTYSTNKYLEEPGTNDYVNSWGPVLNTNFSRIDAAFGAITTINLTGVSGTLNLTNAYPIPTSPPYSYIAPTIILANTPSGNVIITVPSGIGGVWNVIAAFGGSYTVTFSSGGGGTSVVLSQNYNNQVMSDGNNIRLLTYGGRSVGTSANNLVALDGSSKLPAVDGSQLTNLPSSVPAGSMINYGGSSVPSGWLLCDGSSQLRASYAALFAAIGTTYGSSSGTTFNLPDGRGRILAGKDNMGGSAAGRLTTAGSGVDGATLGASGGSQTHTLTIAQMPLHGHAARISTGGASDSTGGFLLDSNFDATYPAYTGTPSVTAGQQIGGTGGDGAHNNVQPTLVTNIIIKT